MSDSANYAATFMTVGLTSVLGSLHCAAMCGAFSVVVASGPRPWSRFVANQSSRIAAYVGLGALAGFAGAGLERSSLLATGQSWAAPVLGTTLIALAGWEFWGRRTGTSSAVQLRTRAGPRRGWLHRPRAGLFRRAREPDLVGAAAAGLISALLPCAWLWSFLALAAARRDAVQGAWVMLAFGLGTLPALGLVAGLGRRGLGAWGTRLRGLAIAIIAAWGVVTWLNWLGAPPRREVPGRGSPGESGASAECGGRVSSPSDAESEARALSEGSS